jgi:aminoglycoside 3-N-acetyltransferase
MKVSLMSDETATTAKIETMTTPDAIRHELHKLGVRQGDVLLTHTSLSKLGWVPNGAQSVAEAMVQSVGKNGLICVPTFSAQNTDPANWKYPPVPAEWHDEIRATMSAYQAATTPSLNMGAINEVIRTMPEAVRNAHPSYSFAAVGHNARDIVTITTLKSEFGEQSPLARLYDADAKVLFLGTSYANCTCFHLGEHRAGGIKTLSGGAAMIVDSKRQWVVIPRLDYRDDDFATLGNAFEARSHTLRKGKVGQADCQLFSIREAVDFAQKWILENR